MNGRLALALLLLAPAAWGQAPEVSVTGLRNVWYGIPSGGEVTVFSDPWRLVVGGGADMPSLGRSTKTGDPRPENDPSIKPLFVGAEVGLYRVWRTEPAEFWVGPQVVGYRVWEGSAPAFPDWRGNVYAALLGGIRHDRRTSNAHGLTSGYRLDLQAEWTPGAASLKNTDYYRIRARSSWYVPLWDLPGENQLFSGLLALRANAQYTGGGQVPLVKLDGTEVRGHDSLFDARALTVGTAELRVRLPSLSGTRGAVPVVFGFFDAGTYAGYADSGTAGDRSGWLAGAGGGVAMEFSGKFSPSFTVAYPLDGAPKTLWWDFSLSMAF